MEAGAGSRRTGRDDSMRPTVFYHGTSIEAAFAIQKDGFRIDKSGSNAGQLLGLGVYMSGTLAKALSYADKHSSGGIVFELHVDLGNCKACTQADLDGKGAWQQQGFDSAWAREGVTPSKLEENCVKDPRRVKLVRAIAGNTGQLRAMGMSIGEDGRLAMIGDLADGTSDQNIGDGGGAGGGQKRKRDDANHAYSPSVPMMCQECEDAWEGTHFCEDCSLVLCGYCTRHHQRSKRSKHHTLQTVTEFIECLRARSKQPAAEPHDQLATAQKEADDFLRRIQDVQHPLGLPDIIAGMRKHKAPSVQKTASLALWSYTCSCDDRRAFVKEGGIEAVADVMMSNKACEEIQFWGCRALMQLAEDSDECSETVATDESVGAILEAMKERIMSVNTPVMALKTLALLAKNNCPTHWTTIVEQGGIAVILQVIDTWNSRKRRHQQQKEIQVWGFRALENLAEKNPENAKIVLAQGTKVVLQTMTCAFAEQADLRVLAAACRVVGLLAKLMTEETGLSPTDASGATCIIEYMYKSMRRLRKEEESTKIGKHQHRTRLVCEIQVRGFRALLSLVDSSSNNKEMISVDRWTAGIVQMMRAVCELIPRQAAQECLELLEGLVARSPDVRLAVLELIIHSNLTMAKTSMPPKWFEMCVAGLNNDTEQMAWEKFVRTLALPEIFLLNQATVKQQGTEDVTVQTSEIAAAAGPREQERPVHGDDCAKMLFNHLVVRVRQGNQDVGQKPGLGVYPRRLYLQLLRYIIESTDDRWFKEVASRYAAELEWLQDVLRSLNELEDDGEAGRTTEALFRLLLTASHGNLELLDVYTDDRTAARQTLVGGVISRKPDMSGGDSSAALGLQKVCSVCKTSGVKLRACSHCQSAFFCAFCRTVNWSAHKEECQRAQHARTTRENVPSYYKLLLACCLHRTSFIEYLIRDCGGAVGDDDSKGGAKEEEGKEGGGKGKEKAISQPAAGHTGFSDGTTQDDVLAYWSARARADLGSDWDEEDQVEGPAVVRAVIDGAQRGREDAVRRPQDKFLWAIQHLLCQHGATYPDTAGVILELIYVIVESEAQPETVGVFRKRVMELIFSSARSCVNRILQALQQLQKQKGRELGPFAQFVVEAQETLARKDPEETTEQRRVREERELLESVDPGQAQRWARKQIKHFLNSNPKP